MLITQKQYTENLRADGLTKIAADITALYPEHGGSTFTLFLPHYKQSHSTRQ